MKRFLYSDSKQSAVDRILFFVFHAGAASGLTIQTNTQIRNKISETIKDLLK